MPNYSYLLKTVNCSKVHIDWKKFKSQNLHYHYIYDKSYLRCKTLLDYAIYLNSKKLYGYFEYYYSKIFDNLLKCLIWPENDDVQECKIYFDYEHLNKIWCLNISRTDDNAEWYLTVLDFDYEWNFNELEYIKYMNRLIYNGKFEREDFSKAMNISKIFM